MEASEKPQLPLEPDRSDGAVRAIGDRLVIERLEVNDPAAARVVQEQVREGHQPSERVRSTLQESRQQEQRRYRARLEPLTAEVTARRERLGAKDELEAEQSRGTAKGRDFEEKIHEVIDQVAATRDDVAHHVGDLPG